MTRIERIERVKEYARARLREEVARGPRGTQARLKTALKTSSANVANMVNHDRGPGQEMLHALADYWGLTYAQLEAAALGDTVSEAAQPRLVPDGVQRVIVKVANARGYPDDVLTEALRVRSLRGTGDMTEEEADELLNLAKSYLKSASRIGTVVADAGTGNALDDFGPGAPKLRR